MKIFTTACLVASVLLCFVCMMLLSHVHEVQTRAAKLVFVDELAATTGLMILSVIGSAVGAIVIVRQSNDKEGTSSTANSTVFRS